MMHRVCVYTPPPQVQQAWEAEPSRLYSIARVSRGGMGKSGQPYHASPAAATVPVGGSSASDFPRSEAGGAEVQGSTEASAAAAGAGRSGGCLPASLAGVTRVDRLVGQPKPPRVAPIEKQPDGMTVTTQM